MDRQRHAGHAAVVTGAAGGIGLSIARRLAGEGARVAVADIACERLDAVAAELMTLGAPHAIGVACDLSQEDSAQTLHDRAAAAFGRVDVLVNNAGGGIIRPFLEHTPQTLRQTIDRNLWTTLWCCRAFLPGMIDLRCGRIVNISADSVHTGTYSHAGYNAAKGGVNGLTTGLAFEFGSRGITVNAVSPGGVMTPDLRRLLDADAQTAQRVRLTVDPRAILATIPTGRFAEMDEVAALVAFLASAEAASINGQIYSVNGGQWMM